MYTIYQIVRTLRYDSVYYGKIVDSVKRLRKKSENMKNTRKKI